MLGWSHRFLGITSTFWGVNVPCSRTQKGLTRVGLEPPTSGISSLDTRCCDSMRSGTICSVWMRFVNLWCPISYDRVALSDKITYVRIWNIPIEYRIIMIRAPDLAPSNTCRSIHLDTLQHVHHVPVRSVAVGCSFGFTTLTITIVITISATIGPDMYVNRPTHY